MQGGYLCWQKYYWFSYFSPIFWYKVSCFSYFLNPEFPIFLFFWAARLRDTLKQNNRNILLIKCEKLNRNSLHCILDANRIRVDADVLRAGSWQAKWASTWEASAERGLIVLCFWVCLRVMMSFKLRKVTFEPKVKPNHNIYPEPSDIPSI